MNEAALRVADETIYQETSAGFSKVLGGYSHSKADDTTGADIIRPREFLQQSGLEKRYPLWNVLVDNIPLSSTVRYEGRHWFAEIDWLNIFGEGSSPKEAIEDLETHIDHFINLYSNQLGENLTEYALELKQRFEKIVLQR